MSLIFSSSYNCMIENLFLDFFSSYFKWTYGDSLEDLGALLFGTYRYVNTWSPYNIGNKVDG